MKYVRRGSWKVLDRDEFLNITIKVFYELFVFVLESQVESSEAKSKCQGLAHVGLGTITVVPKMIESQQSQGNERP